MDAASAEPLVMPLDLLREITNDFSEERKLGSGSFGKVYKGVHQDGRKIAVKMLYDMPGLDDKEVQVKYEGKLVLAEKTHRALCLEYVSNGSLDKYLSDGCDRYDWHTGYGIINGICQGLKYLHSELKPPIYHLDLKPANVLLDENMVPRIADFGMSRLFTDEQTRATRSSLGTFGYLPPEYIHNNLISNKFDIFSLGVVIIKIMAGRAGYLNSAEMPSQEFTDLVQENWTNRLLETLNLRRAYSEQVKICIEIGLSCVQEDRHKRPTIQDIVDRLNETVANCTYAARKDGLLIYQDSFEENAGPAEARLDGDSPNDNQEYSADGDSLPGVEGFRISGDPRPGSTLRACGFSINGTTLGHFQWVHYLEDGTRHSIEDATMSDYVVTADDVGTILAVDCTPMDDNGRQGNLVREFANNANNITCDPELQNDVNICISRGRADFDVFVLQGYSPKEWEHASLVLKQTGYQVNFIHKDNVVIDEKYSPNLQLKIPNGRTTQFVLLSSRGVNLPFNTQGITEPNTEDNDVRLRDLIVLVMRAFRNKACMSPPVPPKEDTTNSLAKTINIDDIPSSSTTNPIAEPPALRSNKRWISSFFKRKGKA